MATIEDPAVTAIAELTRNGQVPTYFWLKDQFGRRQVSDEVYRSLNRGRAILTTVDQLNQYLFSYAPMVASQWQYASSKMTCPASDKAERLIDYGCGQGLAGLLLHDYLGPSFISSVRTVIAIEPSRVALQRAVAVYEGLARSAVVIPVNKAFATLGVQDFRRPRWYDPHFLERPRYRRL